MKTILRPGSAAWLLAHDIRLGWRELRGTFRALHGGMQILLVLVLMGVLHAAVWPIVAEFIALPRGSGGRTQAIADAAPVAAFVMLLMSAQALNVVTRVLFSRGDLDLLLSSPLSPRKILFARMLAVATGAFASAAIFILPLADTSALQGSPRLLAAYPALAGGALLAASGGLVTTSLLFAAMGPRRTRLAAQIAATLLGASFMLALQLHRFLPHISLEVAWGSRALLVRALSLPVRAALGEPVPLAAWLVASVAAFAASCLVLGPRFARNVVAAATTTDAARRRGGRSKPAVPLPEPGLGRRAFGAGTLGALRLKEWRLIARDPWVVSQLLLQILYMSPMILVLWSGTRSASLALAPMIVVVTFQVASSLTWLGLSGEDAVDLLRTAPVAAAMLRRGKVEAVGLLTLAIVFLPSLWLAWTAPRALAPTLVLCGVALAVAVVLQTWHSKPARRTAFAGRHRESKLVALIEMAVSMLLGISTAMVVLGTLWCVLPLACCGVVVLCSRPGKERRGPATSAG